jgi:hypothetical protein
MARGVARYLVGSLVVLGLAACGKVMFAERDAWRHEAEIACLKAGQVKEGPSLARIEPISGPGICGADFPLKVAAIGDGAPIGFVDELRPPGAIPNRQPLAVPPPGNYSRPATYDPYPPQQQIYPQQTYPRAAAPNGPMPIQPPGSESADGDDDLEYENTPPAQAPAQAYPRPQYGAPPKAYPQRPQYGAPVPYEPVPYEPAPDSRAPSTAQPYPPQSTPPRGAEQVPLGRERALVATGAVAVQPTATLACPIVSALDTWFASGVQPAALKWFGVQVAEIRQISAYSCRGMNGQPGARISEHAFGNALDIASFTLADGRKVAVKDGWRGAPEEQGFLRDVQGSACQHFSTVLAPGSNAFHYDHIHVDLMRRSSARQVCNPAPVPGDVVAARAGYRFARGEPAVTGSIKRARIPTFRSPLGRDEVYDGLPRAVPGED